MKSEYVEVDANDLKNKTKGQDFVGDVKDVPKAYGPHKTLYNRFRRWTGMGVFDRIFSGLAAQDGPSDTMMIDATHLKAHRTAASLLKGDASAPYRAN